MNITGKLNRLTPEADLFSEVIKLDQAAFPRPWAEKNWVTIGDGFHHLLAYQAKNEILGFSLYHFLPGDDTAHLLKICLKEELRGTGVVRDFWISQLQYLLEAGPRSIYLEVELQNMRAQSFYRKVGFKELRKISKYYSDGQDAVVMQLTL